MSRSALQDKYEIKLWQRALFADGGDFPPEVARAVLDVKFSEADQQRASELAQKNQRGELSAEEKAEMEAYVRVGLVISILWAKARLSLKRAGQPDHPAA
ncbi:MAG: hypothetical protein WD768_22905 [Phycisphaeraceae bacterium]